jgi:hypothetical protein
VELARLRRYGSCCSVSASEANKINWRHKDVAWKNAWPSIPFGFGSSIALRDNDMPA